MRKIPDNLGSDYYRTQLTIQGKQFYDSITAQCILGEYSGDVSVEIIDEDTAPDDGFAAFKAVRNDHPEYFYLGTHYQFYQRGSRGIIKCQILYTPEQIARIQIQLERLIDNLVRGTEGKPVRKQEKIVYERIARKLTYVKNNDASDHNIVRPLLCSTGVCEGYNALLLLCFRRLGIPCVKIHGKSMRGENHCWCLAFIEGIPVHCDVTWDSTVSSEDEKIHFYYFNLSDRQIEIDHCM